MICPRCDSRRLVFGELVYGVTIGASRSHRFRAYASRLSSFRLGVDLRPASRACAACGLVWTELDPLELIEHLQRHAGDEVRAWIRDEHDAPL